MEEKELAIRTSLREPEAANSGRKEDREEGDRVQCQAPSLASVHLQLPAMRSHQADTSLSLQDASTLCYLNKTHPAPPWSPTAQPSHPNEERVKEGGLGKLPYGKTSKQDPRDSLKSPELGAT